MIPGILCAVLSLASTKEQPYQLPKAILKVEPFPSGSRAVAIPVDGIPAKLAEAFEPGTLATIGDPGSVSTLTLRPQAWKDGTGAIFLGVRSALQAPSGEPLELSALLAIPDEERLQDLLFEVCTESTRRLLNEKRLNRIPGGLFQMAPPLPAMFLLFTEFDFSQIKVKMRPPAPRYPSMAMDRGIQGNVVVQIVVGEQGVPVCAYHLNGPEILAPTALAYALQWRFEPAVLNGRPVAARFKLTMPFRLPNSGAPGRNEFLSRIPQRW